MIKFDPWEQGEGISDLGVIVWLVLSLALFVQMYFFMNTLLMPFKVRSP